MEQYKLNYSGAEVNTAVQKSLEADTDGGIASKNWALGKTEAADLYPTKTGTGATGNWNIVATGGSYGFRQWTSLTLAANNYSDQDITITTHGRPVYCCCMGDINPSNNAWGRAYIYRDNVELAEVTAHEDAGQSINRPFGVQYLDTSVTAGTHTYKFRLYTYSGTIGFTENGAVEGPTCVCFEI